MLSSVGVKTVRDYNRSIAFWILGLFLTALMMMSVYPSVKESAPQLADYVKNMPDAFKAMFGLEGMDYTSPAGYLNTELFSMMLPIAFAAFAIGAGSRAIAGEEDRKTLDLLLSTPVSRGHVVVQKALAMLVDVAALSLALWASLWLTGLLFDFKMGPVRLLEASLNCGALGLVIGTVALATGAWKGGRGLAVGVAGTVLVAAFLLRSLAEVVDGLRPFRFLSPFYWYSRSDVLRNGLSPGDIGILLLASAVFILLAVAALDRRDLQA